jgi:hypothetical protein
MTTVHPHPLSARLRTTPLVRVIQEQSQKAQIVPPQSVSLRHYDCIKYTCAYSTSSIYLNQFYQRPYKTTQATNPIPSLTHLTSPPLPRKSHQPRIQRYRQQQMTSTKHSQGKDGHKLINIPTPRNEPSLCHNHHRRNRQK